MPLTRYQSRNEYGLADPDLYQAADKDDPEALLEGVAMAGLVGILRQLGDLAEFAAEMFHDLHEEVMATASRSHGLMARVQQLEAEFPSIEKALLCQTDHSPFFSYKGVEWHPNLQLEQSVVTRGDLPRCVMDSYEECRGPPRLFLLDKFDISGAGACLKRYTDPSFVRLETSSYEESWDDIQKEKKSQKAKRRATQWRNGGTPENALSSHAKLHELFLEEHLETHHLDPARVVKLKTRKLDGCTIISKSGESYMEKFVQTRVDSKISYEIITQNPGLLTWNMDSTRDIVTDIPEISMVDAMEKSHGGSSAEVSLPSEQENVTNGNLNRGLIEKDIETVPESTSYNEVHGTTFTKDSQTNLNEKPGLFQQRSYSEDLTSDADNYVDAPATMESETETDDEYRTKNRSDALKDENHHTYSDADEERMEDPPQFSFFHSNGNTPVSENGRSSFGKRSTSYSYSDTASVSIDDQSDGEKLSGCLPSTSSFKSELHVTPEASKVSNDYNVHESVSSSNVDGQTSLRSNDTCSSPRPVSQNDESCPRTVQSLAPVDIGNSPELDRLDLINGGNDVSKVDPIDCSRSRASFDAKNSNFPSESSSISSTSEGSRCYTTIEKNDMVDCSSDLVKSATSPQVFVDIQTGEQLRSGDNDIETNSTVAWSKVVANSGSDPEGHDGSSLAGKLLPCSAGKGMEVSPDIPDKVCGPSTVDEIHLKNALGDETDCVTVTNVVADVDSENLVTDVNSQNSVDSQTPVADVGSQNSVAEISNEHSGAFGNTAGVSVSESHEDTLENGMSMPAEVNSKLTFDFNSGGEKLGGDASSACSKSDEHISDEGFHDLSGLDNATTDIVPNIELDVSDNDSDTSSGGVNHAVSLSSTSLNGSLPWIPINTYRSSPEAGEICQDTVVESDGTLPAEDNLESEIKMQKSPQEVSSEGLNTSLDNNDLASCESISPKPSQDQRHRDTETSYPGESILVDNCIDSSPVNNLNLIESEALEQTVREQTPCASHTVADEEFLQSNVFGGLEFVPQSAGLDFAPQSAGIELNRPNQELNLDPTFPSFGLIPETTPPNQEDMPPLPPLPPMQWRIGKVPHSFPTFMGESVETSSSVLSAAPPSDFSLDVQIGSKSPEMSVSLGSDESEQLPGGFVNNASETPLQSSIQFPTIDADSNSQYDSPELPTMPNQGCIEDFGSEVNNLLADNAVQNHELVYSQEPSLQQPQDLSAKYEDLKDDTDFVYSQEPSLQLPQDLSADLKDDTDVLVSLSSTDDHHCPETKSLTPTQSTKVEDESHCVPDASNADTAEPSNTSVQKIIPGAAGDAMWPVNAFSVAPTLDTDKPEVVPTVRLPRPRSPLVDAVAAHDRRTMKKVSEMVHPPIKSKQDDKDSLLAQIRNKSVNLKPAAATRPSIQTGPKTNIRVAAILEKANTIRQAMAGSDEDEDSDSWSDS